MLHNLLTLSGCKYVVCNISRVSTITPLVALAGLGLLCSFERISGGNGGGVTPVPIPNTAVKPSSADGTWDASPWKSRSLPDSF